MHCRKCTAPRNCAHGRMPHEHRSGRAFDPADRYSALGVGVARKGACRQRPSSPASTVSGSRSISETIRICPPPYFRRERCNPHPRGLSG